MRFLASLAVISSLLAVAVPARAQTTDILMSPKTLFDRMIEARSASDIARDNSIVIDVNKVMAELGTINAKTEIYEQTLLVTGLFNDPETYRKFEAGVRAVEGVKKLYWHVSYMTAEAEAAAEKEGRLMEWSDVVVLDGKAKGRLIATKGLADVNFRVTADAFGNLYLLGRARSREELQKAMSRLEEDENVKKLYTYAFVRP